ncbi:hypothetical protein F511_20305 [Dorcoceras hygrometricum]|uniref:Uncharacterized protein n=1 Tax=Dorcoceras hygrometricum TaxID=472368 RepID=A0A2Z7B1M1_9LAMI|nr:hypothetical protein F511_20305 [Dorcoceras hygrometricum]
MDLVYNLAKRAASITKFVYNHAFLLVWLRKREGWTEIVRPGPTRFATTFIALKSILEHLSRPEIETHDIGNIKQFKKNCKTLSHHSVAQTSLLHIQNNSVFTSENQRNLRKRK